MTPALPSVDVGNHARWADWVEMCALLGEPPQISTSDIAEALKEAGLITGLEGDSSFTDEPGDGFDATEDNAELMAQELLLYLHDRQLALGSAYPFIVSGDEVTGPVGGIAEAPAYALLLFADVGQFYEPLIRLSEGSSESRLFELVVEASMRGLCGGECARFGWPIEPGWPTSVEERVERLGYLLDLAVEDLTGKVQPADKDMGLDVAARVRMYGGADGTVAFLLQAATGHSWTAKKGEPSLDFWNRILRWQSVLVRGVAVPWRLEGLWGYVRTYQYFEASVFDRFRLAWGDPDSHLESSCKGEIAGWCREKAAGLPRLD